MKPKEVVIFKSGEPCSHPGCLSHATHPCEVCGRVQGMGEVKISKELYNAIKGGNNGLLH